MTADTEQILLGELRAIRRAQDDLDMRLRIDPLNDFRRHLSSALDALRSVPMGARVCVLVGVVALGVAALYRSARLAFIGVDLLFASLLFVGVGES